MPIATLTALKTWYLDLENDNAPTEAARAQRARRRRILNSSAAGRTYRPHEINEADFEGAEALVFGYFDELTVS